MELSSLNVCLKMLPRMFEQPGCVNTTEIDIKKACKVNNPFTVTKVGHFHIRQYTLKCHISVCYKWATVDYPGDDVYVAMVNI